MLSVEKLSRLDHCILLSGLAFLFADSHSGLQDSNIVSPITVCPVPVDTRCVIPFIC